MSKSCRGCGKPLPKGKRGQYCSYACAFAVVMENARQLQAHEGPYYETWKKSVPWTETLQQEEE